MYSLDQVIYFLEQRQQTEDWNIRDAAIAYLKGYREVLPEYAQMKLDAVKNEPLTWDELRTMEGKPVWIEMHRKGYQPWSGWEVIDYDGVNDSWMSTYRDDYIRSKMGEEWQAYREERK